MKVTAKVTNPGDGVSAEPVTVEYDFGDNLADMTSKFGEDVIQSRARASLVIDLQSAIRRHINAGKSDDEITAAVAAWVPGVKAAAKSPADKLKALLDGKSDEEKLKILQEAGIM